MRIAPLTALILLSLSPLAQAQTPAAAPTQAPAAANAPLAVVNGKPIPALYGELVGKQMAQGQPKSAQLDTRVRDSLINLELLSQEATKKGLEKDPRVAAMLSIGRMDQLAKAYLEDYVKAHPITDAEAKKLIADLNNKAKFDDLAKKYSKDPGSAKNGGKLDWSDRRAFVPEFSNALAGLKKGETTQTPVKTQFGWHVIRLDDTRKPQIPPLDAVRGEITQQLQQQRVRQAIEAARAGAKIE
jgi:peptidyl-prolyl cis-trans isomerase C